MKKIFLAQFDTFRPTFEPPKDWAGYAGELSLACVQEDDAFSALEQMLNALKSGGAVLRSIEFFGEFSEFEGDMSVFGLEQNELAEAALGSERMVFSNKVYYEADE